VRVQRDGVGEEDEGMMEGSWVLGERMRWAGWVRRGEALDGLWD